MSGRVTLVGAGPGAADLLTLRGLRALQSADAIVVDVLVPAGYLAELGLDGGDKLVLRLADNVPRWSQARITGTVIAMARRGLQVARLKGGDPGVFGRLAEELEELRRAGLTVEAVPGPSVATAAATASGVPLTVRGTGRSLALVTARTRGGGDIPEFPVADTLAIYMGVVAAPAVQRRLVEQGWSCSTPVRILERATMPFERVLSCRLSSLPETVLRCGVRSPALLVVGAGAAADEADRSPIVLYTGNAPHRHRHLGHLLHWPVLPPAARRGTLRAVSSDLPACLPEVDLLLYDSQAELSVLESWYGAVGIASCCTTQRQAGAPALDSTTNA